MTDSKKNPTQIVLSGRGCSRRAVRFVELTVDQVDELGARAYELVGNEGTVMQLRQTEIREGVKHMLVAVSKRTGIKDDELLTESSEWNQVDVQKLSNPDNELAYERLFSAKDHSTLARIYQKYHGSTDAEVEDILGKAKAVSSD